MRLGENTGGPDWIVDVVDSGQRPLVHPALSRESPWKWLMFNTARQGLARRGSTGEIVPAPVLR